jgi:hypothetical protein
MVMGWKTCFTGMAGSDQPPEVLEQSAAALASEHCDKKRNWLAQREEWSGLQPQI